MSQGHKNVLLVNMIDVNSEIVGDLLDLWGFHAIRNKGKEIKAEILSTKPSIILYQVPEFSDESLQILTNLCNLEPDIPVVTISPFISLRNAFRVSKTGVKDFLVQPINPMELKSIIENYTESLIDT